MPCREIHPSAANDDVRVQSLSFLVRIQSGTCVVVAAHGAGHVTPWASRLFSSPILPRSCTYTTSHPPLNLNWGCQHRSSSIVVSPFTSYVDQIWSIHRTRSSAGFSLDIPLIMLVSSILRCYYWLGAHFDRSLLVQALNMIGIQLLLLKIALDNRPQPSHKGGVENTPFAGAREGDVAVARPYNFWQWRSRRP